MPKHHTCISFTYKGAPCSIFPHGYLHSTTVPARQTSSYVQALVRGTHLITDQHCSSPALLYTSAHKRFTGAGTGAGMPCCNAAHTKRRPLQTPLTTYVPRCSLIICMDEPYACQLHTLPGGQHLQWESSKQHGPVQSLLPTPHLLQLRSRVAPFWSRFSASELDSPDRNRLENTLARI